jgi:ribosomal protein S18 acetylase RimI-like enzyme
VDAETQAAPVLRPGTEADSTAAAGLHSMQIEGGFLSFLGPEFLRLLYRRIVRHPASFLVVAEEDRRVVGFVAGSTDVSGLYGSFVWHDGIRAAAACTPRLLRSWRQAIETLRHGAGQTGVGAELLAIAVEPGWRGRGTGARLVEGFLTEAGRHGETSAHVVVAAANGSAIALYDRAGFRTADRIELHAGTDSIVMQWESPRAPLR